MGSIGAASVNNRVDARYAIALDVALIGDIPTVDWLDVPVRLGDGPVIVQKDLLLLHPQCHPRHRGGGRRTRVSRSSARSSTSTAATPAS